MSLAIARGRTLRRYLVGGFLPVLAASLLFFVLMLELVDLFAGLWRYLQLDVPPAAIARVALLYAPACVSYALPAALLFATAYSLGGLYARNELVAVFGAGVRLASFVAPLLAIAALLSVASFFFDDRVVLPSLREKGTYSRELLRQTASKSNADVAVISRDGSVVYRAEYYDDSGASLTGLTVVERDGSGAPSARTDAPSARWDGTRWLLSRARRFERRPDGSWTESSVGTYASPLLDEPPDAFRSQNRNLREMTVAELGAYVAFLSRAGLPHAEALAERHKRFAFSFAPLVVVLLSSALGGSFRKNVLLMSLLASLLTATGYYVTQMVTMLLAKTGLLPPAAGAWTPLLIFAGLGAELFRRARS